MASAADRGITAASSGEAASTGAEDNSGPQAAAADGASIEPVAAAPAASEAPAPGWARRMRRRQAMIQGATLAAHTLRGADHHGGAAHISLEDRS